MQNPILKNWKNTESRFLNPEVEAQIKLKSYTTVVLAELF